MINNYIPREPKFDEIELHIPIIYIIDNFN